MKSNEGPAVAGATEAVSVTPPDPWQTRISAFATAVAKPEDEIVQALASLVGTPGPEAASALSDPEAVHDEDLVASLVKEGPRIPLGIFRKHLPKLRGAPPVSALNTDRSNTASFEVLPSVPEDTSFLEMLKVGGVLKVGETEVVSAMKAAIADYLGLYDLPKTIVRRMEEFAEAQVEPVGESFYKLRKMVVTRSYGEIFSVLGIEGSFATDKRKNDFLDKLNGRLWPALRGFHTQVVSWQDTWAAGATNPAMLLLALAPGGRGSAAMPPGLLMQAPDTATIRDEAEAVINKINGVFAGVGIPIARALAFEATRMKSVLEDPTLPAAIGSTTKDQMLRSLDIAVGADYVRLERNVTRYALAIMEFPKVPAGNEEYGYLGAMMQLGAAIPWDKLPGGSVLPASSVRANGSRARRPEHQEQE